MTIQVVSLCFWIFWFYAIGSSAAQCLNDQRSLLLQLNNTLKLVNWDVNLDCCKWDGVGCDGSGHVISLGLDGRLSSIDLKNATGLFGFQFLETLNLAENSFSNSAEIPKGLGKLTRLAYLNLSNSGFSGQVPMEISKLRSLVSLDLSTQFPGILPLKLEKPDLKILVQNLTSLRELNLDGVNISQPGSEWCQSLSSSLPNLRKLSLRRCGLSGPLHPSLLRLQHLSVLQLDQNNLLTTVPDFIANFSSLTTLTMSFCSLSGTFPDIIFQLPSLQNLDLTNNVNLSGTISHLHNNNSFRSMLLSNCRFSGQIPSSVGNLKELTYLDLSINSFTGTIPLFLMSKNLEYIDLSRNDLKGSLSPTHFEDLFNLVSIYLGHNALTGEIPDSLFGLPSLQKLDLSNNKFSGQLVMLSPWNSSKLDTLDLSSNQLEGLIPEAIFNFEQLKILSLSYNSFNGTVQLAKFQKLQYLSRLGLGYNYLSVDANSRNSSLSHFPQLGYLNLASCNLYNYPDLLRNQSHLGYLDLSNNHISGEIPRWIWEVANGSLSTLNLSFNCLVDLQKPFKMPQSLTILDLHSNRLRGVLPIPVSSERIVYVDYSNNSFEQPIPYNIGNSLRQAFFFSVASNKLNGTIPHSLCDATALKVLDLSGNNLTGSLPPCLLKNVSSLGVLNLRRNNITGDFPDTISVDCSLQTLDFSSNNFGGMIPTSLANCRSLEVVNVRNNKFHGGFPSMLKHLPTLRVLVLRNNKFQGDLACSWENKSWPYLQIIDIASNNFNGSLPGRCISSWGGMGLGTDGNTNSSHLRFNFMDLNDFYYQDTVTVITKGMEMELVKILTIFKSIDFSSNNFQGKIPDEIGDLLALYTLNLSHNALNSTIPKSLGNLKQLGSLDLSGNQLTGEIPEALTSLTFLSFLNLSYNNLQGKIPLGPQFLTFSSSSYQGNSGLCGFPLYVSCNTGGPTSRSVQRSTTHQDGWLLIFIVSGYGVGVALVISSFLLFPDGANRRLDHIMRACIYQFQKLNIA